MTSPLSTSWTRLLMLANRRNVLSEREQKIVCRHTFYKLMDAMAAVGWLKCVSEDGNGFIKRKRYEITFEGALIAGAFEGKL